MVTNSEAWQAWHKEHGRNFGQFIRAHEAEKLRDAAPESLRSATLNADALAVGHYMRRWQESAGILAEAMPCVPGDTFSDPVIEFSKIVGFLGA